MQDHWLAGLRLMARSDAESSAGDSALAVAVSIDRAKMIYRFAIDARACDAEGDAWWQEVQHEVSRVLGARSLSDAADVIAWWHHDWSCVGDTPRAAAKRLRTAGRALRPLSGI